MTNNLQFSDFYQSKNGYKLGKTIIPNVSLNQLSTPAMTGTLFFQNLAYF